MPPFFCLKRHGVRDRVLDAVDTVINALTDAGFMIAVADAPAKSAEGGTGAQQAVIPDNTAFLVVSIAINEVRNFYILELDFHFLAFLFMRSLAYVAFNPLSVKIAPRLFRSPA